jgi:hypothetical protein
MRVIDIEAGEEDVYVRVGGLMGLIYEIQSSRKKRTAQLAKASKIALMLLEKLGL